jgi:hypothetical protein
MPDYKLPALAGIDQAYRTALGSLKNEQLQEVATAFVRNADRIVFGGLFPARLLNLADHFLPVYARALHKVLGDNRYKLKGEAFLGEAPKITEECKTIAANDSPGLRPALFSREWLERLDGQPPDLRDRWESLLSLLETMAACTGDFLTQGIESTLSGMIVGTWTAIETLAGDLWEAAVNIHPGTLSELKGKKKAAEPAHNDQTDTSGAQIPITRLQEFDYNVRDSMGTLLRALNRVSFATLQDIRDAYQRSFTEDGASVNGTLSDPCLDALAVVRNLLVHKAGVCDVEYERRTRTGKLPHVPKLHVDQLLDLDGALVKELLSPAIAFGVRLCQAVDSWLYTHPEKARTTS